MDGVFMKKLLLICIVLTLILAPLVSDLQTLEDSLIRLHVVGASDSAADQNVKLAVRDAVVSYLSEELSSVTDVEQAKLQLEESLPRIEEIANEVLASRGFDDTVTVTLTKEEFPRRDYDTFSLPAGVYESLRIRIGQAQGRNWWCVVFPSLCVPAASEDTRSAAAGAGFSDNLTQTITNEDYELRFWLLDCLGSIQNFFHQE